MNIYQILSENSRRSPLFAFLLSLILYLIGAMLLLSVFVAILSLLSGTSLEEINGILSGKLEGTARELAIFRLIQGSNQLLSWGMAGLLMAYLLGRPEEVLKLQKIRFSTLVFPLLILICSLPLVQAVTFTDRSFHLTGLGGDIQWLREMLQVFEEWTRIREAESQEVLLTVLGTTHWLSLLANVVVFAVIPAICEEIFFRGYLLGLFKKVWNPHVAVWVSAFLFSLVHMQFYGFFSRLILGAMLAYFVLASGSLYPAMLAHFFFNFLSIVLVQLAIGHGVLAPEVAQDEIAIPLYITLLSLMITVSLIVLYFRRTHTFNL